MPSNFSSQDTKLKIGQIKKQSTWINALQKLNCIVEAGKGSHYVARNNKYPKHDCRSLVLTIQKDIRKDVNERMFSELIKKGYSEKDILKALNL